MASPRYTLNIQPEEPEVKRELTKKEKADNFWHYHKWYFIAGAITLIFVAFMLHDILNVEHPDMQIAVLSEQALPEDALHSLEASLTPLVSDINGDGKTILSVVQYNVTLTDESEQEVQSDSTSDDFAQQAATAQDPYVQMASVTQLSVDLQAGDTMIFIADDIEKYQTAYGMFAYNDKTAPEDGDLSRVDEIGIAWEDSDMLKTLELGTISDGMGTDYIVQDFFENYTVAMRVYEGTQLEQDGEKAAVYENSSAIFEQILG